MRSAALLGGRRKGRAPTRPGAVWAGGLLLPRSPVRGTWAQFLFFSFFFFFFAYEYPVLPATFVTEAILSPLSITGFLVKQESALCAWARFWVLDSVLLVCVSFSASVMIPLRLLSFCSIV